MKPLFIIVCIVFELFNVALSISYHLVYDATRAYTWFEAQAYCETEYGTNLATIIDATALSEVIAMRDTIFPATNVYAWVGLNDQSVEGVWEWVSGASCDPNAATNMCVTFWKENEPNDSSGVENCAELIYPPFNTVYDKTCSTARNQFFCDANYHFVSDSGTARNWFDAQAYCESVYGTNLATVTDATALSEVLAMRDAQFPSTNVYAWIGLNDQNTEGVWEWVSGASCDTNAADHLCVTFWKVNEPNDVNGLENCAELIYPPDNTVYDKACDFDTERYYFFCDVEDLSPTPSPTGATASPTGVTASPSDATLSPSGDTPAPSGVTPSPSEVTSAPSSAPVSSISTLSSPAYYLVHDSIDAYTWNEAQAFCETEYGTNLATAINNASLQELVGLRDAMFNDNVYVWLGLNDKDTEGVWKWVSGVACDPNVESNLCVTYWKENEPNDSSGVENCAELIYPPFNTVYDKTCDTQRNQFFCDKQVDYHFVSDDTARSWFDAQAYCEDVYGTNLATIVDETALSEVLAMRDAAFPNTNVYTWVGLNDQSVEGVWEWVSGASCDANAADNLCVTFWKENEPNDSSGVENCAELIYPPFNTVYDKTCDTERNEFACDAADRSPSQATPSPSEMTLSPSDATSSPSKMTGSPSESTPSPSEATPSPSEATPSPSERVPENSGKGPELLFLGMSVYFVFCNSLLASI